MSDDDVRAAAQRIMDSRPRSIIDGKQWAADIMLVTRYVLADHNDLARLLGELERLLDGYDGDRGPDSRCGTRMLYAEGEPLYYKCAFGCLGSFSHMVVTEHDEDCPYRRLRAALAPAPAGAGEAVIIESNTCDTCNEVIPDGEGYSHHRWCGLEAVAPGASDAGDGDGE